MHGVSGFDNLDGDITDQIQVYTGDYDNTIPGEYRIVYFLTDSSGNSADAITRTITVINSDVFQAPPVYLDTIDNEKPKPPVSDCFQGAWYHKVVSSTDTCLGIEGTITLPKVKITRYEI